MCAFFSCFFSVIDKYFFACVCGVHVGVCAWPCMRGMGLRIFFFLPRHSCNWAGLMCNPSRHFKGRKAWTDVVLLVYQMGLYDEKSIIPIQASLPSLVHYKDLHSFLFFFPEEIISIFFRAPNTTIFFSNVLLLLFLPLSLCLYLLFCFFLPRYLPHLSLSEPLTSTHTRTHTHFSLEDLQMWH